MKSGVNKRDLAALVAGAALAFAPVSAQARPVSMYVVDADVRMVLASVAELGGVSLVLDDSVQGTITIRLDEVEPQEAFALIAAADDLSLSEAGGVTIITAARTAWFFVMSAPMRMPHSE